MFQIEGAVTSDSGIYTCIAASEMGYAEKTININVISTGLSHEKLGNS